MSLGLRWIRDEFGYDSRPHASWQIDTFGHTRGNAEMFALMGFDSLYFARLDIDELAQESFQLVCSPQPIRKQAETFEATGKQNL